MSDLINRKSALKALRPIMRKSDYFYEILKAIQDIPSAQPEIIRCKDCKYFEYDHVEKVSGIPLIVAHEICMRWSDGVKTSENGYCFLAERRTDE